MTAMSEFSSIQASAQPLAIRIDAGFRKLAAVSIYGSSATLFVGLTYGVAQLCYYWPIVQAKLLAIQGA